jgi:protein-S-isoprenylcysteine O-methyltransferase Ste14
MTLTPKLALLAVGMTLGYLLLAILGSGGFAAFFADSARIALTIVFFFMVVAALFTNANRNPGEVEDRSNRWVLLAFTVLGLLGGYLPAYTERMGFWTFGGEDVRWLGVVLCATGGALRL